MFHFELIEEELEILKVFSCFFSFHIASCHLKKKGLFDDEYSSQEQSDGLQILQWIDKQTWSNGKVIFLIFY
jgi:hypothetical protein